MFILFKFLMILVLVNYNNLVLRRAKASFIILNLTFSCSLCWYMYMQYWSDLKLFYDQRINI